ncbi:MAG: cell division protein FtsA [Candidatus Zambryskibacteria bacterium RIFCSPHIGHO2_02_FULL_43_14]|uniref:Cell division protein FtsA n=1 Tax=Candidatus Zambryskibacteria bacterium RIFCSPHIGHO2_02_FULL_43_14 TaxID=1802748 RepID=A0A1G2TF76_9BACT|nr:MAG: cell division protein FtsA [Candidatus Zambryskibacteria bacterium RIFCSPHIGHO2_01_FULL_43_60]OHA95954.1 MAG: cell division protein FtsA [Candidatus Zambryskibacteria bacterium RIFCSPHIGHO2_02_FULL_43_14]OHB03648.1 MAG: cell division protein FtsA [Candidatus Zambryskibacteria bacterium RIFCSPLOWO2_01_FULL_42_41]
MTRQIVVGIDIGTSLVKVVIAEGLVEHGHFVPKIIGTSSAESRGVYRGYITNTTEAAKSIETAVARAEKVAGVKVKRAYISFGGIGLASVVTSGSVAISRADLEITERDLALALENAEAAILPTATINKKIINTIPIEYKTDGKTVWGRALGLKAQKLEVKALFITCQEQHLIDLISAVEEAGIEVVDVVASPVASSFVTLSKKQKRVGCLLADIGAETFSIVIFENNNLISLEVFPVGGNDITNDIALGLKISLEDAEHIKFGDDRRITYSKKKLEEIISTRLGDSFELVETHLKAIGRDALLPAGVILAGGGAAINGIKNVAEDFLELPAQLAEIYFGTTSEGKIKDRSWAVACGLSIVGFNADNEQRSVGIRNGSLMTADGKRWGKIILRWISQFLP